MKFFLILFCLVNFSLVYEDARIKVVFDKMILITPKDDVKKHSARIQEGYYFYFDTFLLGTAKIDGYVFYNNEMDLNYNGFFFYKIVKSLYRYLARKYYIFKYSSLIKKILNEKQVEIQKEQEKKEQEKKEQEKKEQEKKEQENQRLFHAREIREWIIDFLKERC